MSLTVRVLVTSMPLQVADPTSANARLKQQVGELQRGKIFGGKSIGGSRRKLVFEAEILLDPNGKSKQPSS